ncbi:MAG: hypothetical protein A2X48_03280 [Lentisphaerae bacterium GWF2_49_21]|nr:MAG: hypothetical protein A2X48_03280 [Lentisphaerae bacterium GWF2_49_21]
MTVSRALNGSPLVKDETRNRILSQVHGLGYDFETRLRSLREDRMKNIAIHCGEEKTTGVSAFDFYIQLHYFCISQIKRRGFSCNTVDLNSGSPEDLSVLSKCCSLILLSPLGPNVWEYIKAKFPKLKTINMFGEVEGVPTVTPDEAGGGEIAGRHIASKGHTYAGVFLDLTERSFLLRYAGFIAGVHSVCQDVRIDPINFANPPDKDKADMLKEEALDRYFSINRKNLPTVFFVPNCYAAIYLYNYLKRHGILVPEDAGLVGYDNIDYYKMVDRQISRIYFEVKDLAVQAVDIACTIIEKGESPLFTVNLPVKFMDCGSVLPIGQMKRKT